MRLRAVVLAAALVALTVARGAATTVMAPTFEEMVVKARYVFLGEVTSRRSEWRETRDGRAIYTMVTFKVLDPIKGLTSVQTVLDFFGGEVGDRGLRVEGMPDFKVGDRDIVFAHGRARAVSPLVGFMHGRLRVRRDQSGREFVATHDGRFIGHPSDIGLTGVTRSARVSSPMSVPTMIALIRKTIDERPAR